MKTTNIFSKWLPYLLFSALLLISWNYHKDAVSFKSPSELWSDRAGYYIYLPATFFYGFDTHRMPPDLDIATGGGFSIDTVKNKLDTKYTYGVALLQTPFFGAAWLLSKITGYSAEDGFSMIFMRMMMIAAVIYLALGLWFLFRFLGNFFDRFISSMVVLAVFFGTNLYYYAVIDGMMSHLFSFFLFSLFLYSLQGFLQDFRFRDYLLLLVSFLLAILIRPTNILLVFCFLFWNVHNYNEFITRIRLLKVKHLVVFAFAALLLFIPQLAYWKYLSGNWLHFSYRDEGFTNLASPAVAQVLFSPVNGLITFTPLVIFMIAGLGIMFLYRYPGRWLISVLFTAVIFTCASWSMWYFGCSYGQRSFIEYYTLLAIPLGYFLLHLFRMRWLLPKIVVLSVVLFLIYANIRYTSVLYRHERCWFGSTWDWDYYRRSFEKAGVIAPLHQVKGFVNDFENLAIFPARKPSKIFTRSGQYSVDTRTGRKPVILYSARLYEFGYPYPKMVDAALWCNKLSGMPDPGAIVLYAVSHGKVIFRDPFPISQANLSPGTWGRIQNRFIVPDVADTTASILLTYENPLNKAVFVDDLKLRFLNHWNTSEND